VLTRLVETSDGTLRQQELSDDLGWERSRLSRQLARMEARGLVLRGGDTTARRITATDEGRRLAGIARTAHAAAVRRALIDRVPDGSAGAFWDGVDALG
jgi:DNA-binding MarR family transcriptional regulator